MCCKWILVEYVPRKPAVQRCWGGSELVVVAPADDLLAGGAQQDGVLELRRVGALDVAQGRVGIHDAQVAQVLQRHQVFALPQAIQPPPAEGKSTKVFIDNV